MTRYLAHFVSSCNSLRAEISSKETSNTSKIEQNIKKKRFGAL